MSKENIAHAWKDPAGTRELTAEERACVNGGYWVYDDIQQVCYEVPVCRAESQVSSRLAKFV